METVGSIGLGILGICVAAIIEIFVTLLIVRYVPRTDTSDQSLATAIFGGYIATFACCGGLAATTDNSFGLGALIWLPVAAVLLFILWLKW